MKKMIIAANGVNFGALTGGGVAADITDVNNLADGTLAFFDEAGTYIDGSAAITGGDLAVALGGGMDNGSRVINGIDRASLTWDRAAYVAPVAKVMFIGEDSGAVYGALNLPATIAKGDIYGVRIIDKSLPSTDSRSMINIEVVADTATVLTGLTANNIIAKLVAAINANDRASALLTAVAVAAAGNNVGIQFTAATAGKDFTARPTQNLQNATYGESQIQNGTYAAAYITPAAPVIANNSGNGTPEQVKELYDKYKARLGDSAYPFPEFYTQDNNLSTALTYDLHHLTYNSYMSDDNNEKPYVLSLIIAVPSTNVNIVNALTAIAAAI